MSPLIGPHATVLASDWPSASQGQLRVTQHGASNIYYLLVKMISYLLDYLKKL